MEKLCGFLNIYKDKGYTSNDVVKIVKKMLQNAKVGHTGTLDPDAMGVLPICIGKATKLSDYVASEIKEYRAIVSLGKITTTQDSSGEILSEKEVTSTKEEIESVINSFVGDIHQLPPMYSAIKVQGKRLYSLARQGQEVEREKRLIHIFNIKINKFIDEKNIEITVVCSKGTYIRTLCHDIGLKLGCGAHMSYLLRTRTGKFSINNSVSISMLEEIIKNNEINKYIVKIEDILIKYKKVTINRIANKYLYNGNKISIRYIKNNISFDEDEKILVYDENKTLIGIYQVLSGIIRPLTILI